MKVFISWSGEKSRTVALALRGWLPQVINALDPWVSSEDIPKGSRWLTELALQLEATKAGIICLTASNLHADWMLFEAGALSKSVPSSYVSPLLIDIEPSDVQGPLSQLQMTKPTKDDILTLLSTLNSVVPHGARTQLQLQEALDLWWPKLRDQLEHLPSERPNTRPRRDDHSLLTEILEISRNVSRQITDLRDSNEIEPVWAGGWGAKGTRVPLAQLPEVPSAAKPMPDNVEFALKFVRDLLPEAVVSVSPIDSEYQLQAISGDNIMQLPLTGKETSVEVERLVRSALQKGHAS